MKFLADHNIAKSTIQTLVDLGPDVKTLKDFGLQAKNSIGITKSCEFDS